MAYISDAISKHGDKNHSIICQQGENEAKAKLAVALHVEVYFMMKFTEIVKAEQSNRVYQLSSVAGGPVRIFLTFSGNQ